MVPTLHPSLAVKYNDTLDHVFSKNMRTSLFEIIFSGGGLKFVLIKVHASLKGKKKYADSSFKQRNFDSLSTYQGS